MIVYIFFIIPEARYNDTHKTSHEKNKYLKRIPVDIYQTIIFMFKTKQEAVKFKMSTKYAPRTLTKSLMFRRRLAMMCPLGIIMEV